MHTYRGAIGMTIREALDNAMKDGLLMAAQIHSLEYRMGRWFIEFRKDA